MAQHEPGGILGVCGDVVMEVLFDGLVVAGFARAAGDDGLEDFLAGLLRMKAHNKNSNYYSPADD